MSSTITFSGYIGTDKLTELLHSAAPPPKIPV